MIKVTIFGGHEGCLSFDTQFYFTMFGGCVVVRPTLARQVLAQRNLQRSGVPPEGGSSQGADGKARFRQDSPLRGRPFFFTMFGGTEIKSPTLAEEFVDLREAVRSESLTMADCERLITDAGFADASIGSFTIFGGFEEGLAPSEEKKIDGLAIQRHLGNVSEQVSRVLQLGIGQSEGQRRAVLRQAILAEA